MRIYKNDLNVVKAAAEKYMVNGCLEQKSENSEFLLDVMYYLFCYYDSDKAKAFYDRMFSEAQKKNYDITLKIVQEFGANRDFICQIVAESTKLNTGVSDKLIMTKEFATLISTCSLFEQDESNDYLGAFRTKIDSYYDFILNFIRAKKLRLDNPSLKIIQYGFGLVKDDFDDNPIVLEYLANKFIDEFFSGNIISDNEYRGVNLELLLHMYFESAEAIDENKLNTYLITLLKRYDNVFGEYVSKEIKLLTKVKERVKEYIKRWDDYKIPEEIYKYYKMFKKVHDYMAKKASDCSLSEMQLLLLVGIDLGVVDSMLYYGSLDSIIFSRTLCSYDEIMSNLQGRDRIHFVNVKTTVSNILFGPDVRGIRLLS